MHLNLYLTVGEYTINFHQPKPVKHVFCFVLSFFPSGNRSTDSSSFWSRTLLNGVHIANGSLGSLNT